MTRRNAHEMTGFRPAFVLPISGLKSVDWSNQI